MIRRISGIVVDAAPSELVIDVAGVGYLVYVTPKTTGEINEHILLHTHQAIRENSSDLYGFASKEELAFFELLLTLPKIGPKSALQILSQADTSLLQNAIISQDSSHLSKMSGISKKTAEKIVLGLKDAFDTIEYQYHDDGTTSFKGSAAYASDAIDALITLGYPQADARKVIQDLIAKKPEITNTNDAIKEALKTLG